VFFNQYYPDYSLLSNINPTFISYCVQWQKLEKESPPTTVSIAPSQRLTSVA